ncbi:MAG: NAD(P)H-dependent oxidoreductase [Rhizobiales bacterium]|nr:NAD(P)H-dependent oxidoreductase [Hyphomicrobiales bacterium]
MESIMPYKVAIIVGSLRKDSFTRKVVNAAIKLAPANLKFETVEIGNLPLFNQDTEAGDAAVKTFRDKIGAADAVLFATPEHNRSVPSALKNALDWGSRPWGQSKWGGKPAAIISTSMGNIAGFGANHHLRQTLAFLNMPTLGQPEAYIASAQNAVDDKGEIVEASREFFKGFFQAFTNLVSRNVDRTAVAAE